MMRMLPRILSLCIFAFRIKILNGNPCAGLIIHTNFETATTTVHQTVATEKEMKKLFHTAIVEEIIAFGECMIRHAMSNAFVEEDLKNFVGH